MAEQLPFNAPNDDWLEVSDGHSSVLVETEGTDDFWVVLGTAKPADPVDDVPKRRGRAWFPISYNGLSTGQKVYVRAVNHTHQVTVTRS